MTPDDPTAPDPPWLAGYLAGDLDPDPPSAVEWECARRNVARRLGVAPPKRQRRRKPLAVAAAVAGLAVGLGWTAAVRNDAPNPEPTAVAAVTRPAPEHDPLPLAGPGDVRIEAVHGDRAPVLVGFDPLLPDGLDLAGPGDVQIETIRHDPADGPAPRVSDGPADAPMIYAALR